MIEIDFEANLRADGYTEIETQTLATGKGSARPSVLNPRPRSRRHTRPRPIGISGLPSSFNAPFLSAGGSPDEYLAGIDLAIAKGWLIRHRSGVYVKFIQADADLLA